jgi:hypothetical protein
MPKHSGPSSPSSAELQANVSDVPDNPKGAYNWLGSATIALLNDTQIGIFAGGVLICVSTNLKNMLVWLAVVVSLLLLWQAALAIVSTIKR